MLPRFAFRIAGPDGVVTAAGTPFWPQFEYFSTHTLTTVTRFRNVAPVTPLHMTFAMFGIPALV
ncbi:MAG TPA: hypothetical protein VK822_18280 [Acetobacteraceae bacterium]|nr:hypothetical protein [Acetobacteraceae bacterium]